MSGKSRILRTHKRNNYGNTGIANSRRVLRFKGEEGLHKGFYKEICLSHSIFNAQMARNSQTFRTLAAVITLLMRIIMNEETNAICKINYKEQYEKNDELGDYRHLHLRSDSI